MRILRVRAVQTAAVILLTLGFLYIAFRGTEFGKLGEALSRGNYFVASLVIPLILTAIGVRAWRWRYLLAPLKPRTSFPNLFASTMMGYALSNFVPRVGELVRPYTLGNLEGISKSGALGTIVVERVIDMLTLLLLLGGVFAAGEARLTAVFPWLLQAASILFAATLSIVLFLFFLFWKKNPTLALYRRLFGFLPSRLLEKTESVLDTFVEGFRVIREPRLYTMIAVFSILLWCVYLLMMYVPFYAFGLTEAHNLDLSAAAVLLVVSSVSVIIPTPGGTGSFHSLISAVLIGMYGVDRETALSYATVTHAMGYLGVSAVGLVYFLKYNMRLSEALKEPPPPKGSSAQPQHFNRSREL